MTMPFDSTDPMKVPLIVPPKWFWWISAIALIWNLMGVAAFFAQLGMDTSTLPDAQRMFYEAIPAWATAAFGVAVLGGATGCVALLLRKSWAMALFLISLLGLVVQMTHSFVIADGLGVFGSGGLVMPLTTGVIAIALVMFARHGNQRGWLKRK